MAILFEGIGPLGMKKNPEMIGSIPAKHLEITAGSDWVIDRHDQGRGAQNWLRQDLQGTVAQVGNIASCRSRVRKTRKGGRVVEFCVVDIKTPESSQHGGDVCYQSLSRHLQHGQSED